MIKIFQLKKTKSEQIESPQIKKNETNLVKSRSEMTKYQKKYHAFKMKCTTCNKVCNPSQNEELMNVNIKLAEDNMMICKDCYIDKLNILLDMINKIS